MTNGYTIGCVGSEAWTVNTDKLYAPEPVAFDDLYFFAAGAEMTGGMLNPNSFYTHVDVRNVTNDARLWGATEPGGAADYISARPAIVTSTNTILVGQRQHGGTNAVISRSTDYGYTWTEVLRLNAEYYIQGITESLDGTKIYAGTSKKGKVLVSEDDGETWSELSQIAPESYATGAKVTCFCELPSGDIYAGCHGGSSDPAAVMLSTDGGLTWMQDLEGYPVSTSNYFWFGINRLYYHESTNTIWALKHSTGANSFLSYKVIGGEGWTNFEINACNPKFGVDGSAGVGAALDVIFDDSGFPEYIAGIFTLNCGLSTPCVYQYNFNDEAYDVHMGADASFQWPQYIYQLSDLREENIENPGVYACGGQHLLKLNESNIIDLASYGAPFSSGDNVFVPDQIVPWTNWGDPTRLYVVATGMIRIPGISV